jgi:putative ABC transport system permease protein
MQEEVPPKWANRFLEWYCRRDRLEEIQGDAYELFFRAVSHNRRKANLYFIWNVMRFFRWKNIRRYNKNEPSTILSLSMLQNYIKIGWRSLMRKKAFSFINMIGLSIGMGCFLLIFSFVYNELSYDKYAAHYKNIHRVGLQLAKDDGLDDYPSVDMAVASGIKANFPEIIETTRFGGTFEGYIKRGDVTVKEKTLMYADSNALKFFSIPLLQGNEDNALVEPNSIVISQAFAKKYFGDAPAFGEMLTLNRVGLLKVTGIFEKVPEHSHFHADAFISMTTSGIQNGRQTWSNIGFYSYIRLHEHVDAKQLEAKFPTLVEKYVVPEIQEDMGISMADAQKSVNNWKFYLMPLSAIHLHSHTKYEMEVNGDINNVYIFSALAAFVLLLACINFMNLSTAGAAKRAKEIGMRKVLGSLKSNLVVQFMVESVILSLIALAFALALAILLLPFFNQLTGKNIGVDFFLSPQVLTLLVTLGIGVGILAGAYPAFFLSSFHPLRMLKSSASGGTRRGGLRSVLVVFQFAIATALIVATVVAYQQLHYMQNIRIGYDKDQILVLESTGGLGNNLQIFRQKLEQDHRITSVSNASVPIGNASTYGGSEVSPAENTSANTHVTIFSMDYDYMRTLGLELVAGRDFSRDFPSDSLGQNAIINETAMRSLGWNETNVIGNTVVRSGQTQYKVVGVVKDFHYTSAKDKIAPLLILFRGSSPAMLIKTNTNDLPALVDDIKKQWSSFSPDIPFGYFFLDDRFDALYKTEQATEQIFIVFMIIAIIIACLGLYGLSAYSAEQRIKEIGIRKVLGSSVRQIVLLQSREFLLLVLLAIVLATPVAWWSMHQWLQNFGYRITISAWIILAAGGAALVIALITVSFQAVKAALANPVKSLRADG